MMATLPLKLLGDNLGERHRYLNSQVNQAAATGQDYFQDIEALSEQTAVDRLFKIDLAIKLNNVDYILKNLRDDDMLYVSRALKCKWLLERRDIINPNYLEDVLFPQMVMPAISKMKHWLYINLTHPLTGEEFYQYYKSRKFDFAVKFLRHCNNEFLLNEFPKILIQLTPHCLKVLGEKCPKLVKIFFESLVTDTELVKVYLKHEKAFYNSVKCLLKSDPDIFLDITEKYHNLTSFDKLGPLATKYILCNLKNRFMAKSELYVVHLLHIPTVAQKLSVNECQELVIKLARADYLNSWFSYANVEPLVKRVDRNNRAAFKKRVFVEKVVGELVNEWPYNLPGSPVNVDTNCGELHVFHDLDFEPIQLSRLHIMKRIVKKKKGRASDCVMISACSTKSELQKLFDEFRFVGFNGTLHELRVRLGVASSADRRRDMLLVLVSKSGGHPESVESLLRLALRLRNEPVHERAAIVRSLVKRARAWCLPHEVWNMMLEYAHGLGLDGTQSEAQCREGLHAVVLRQLLTGSECEPAVRSAFLDDFSTLEEYKLTASERLQIAIGLQRILMSAAADAEPEVAACHLNNLLDVLERYRLPFKTVVSAVAALAERDLKLANPLLMRLYDARVGRAELLRQYLELRQDDAAFINALRHDPYAVKPEWLIKLLIDDGRRAYQFFSKLSVYFNEGNGMADQFQFALRNKITVEPDVRLARPLAILAGRDMQSLWNEQDLACSSHFKLAASLRANMHHERPAPDALILGWRKAGMKAVAWRVQRCRPVQVQQILHTVLKERDRRTVRLALVLAQRTDCVADIFSRAAQIRPLAALRAALQYYRCLGEAGDPRIWDIVKSSITNVDLTMRKGLSYILKKVDWVPNAIKPEYCSYLYLALDTDTDRNHILRVLTKYLPAIKDILLKNILLRILENINSTIPESYPAIVIRYLMLSKNENELNLRFEEVGQKFLKSICTYRDGDDKLRQRFYKRNLDQIMTALVYNSAFFDVKYQYCSAVIERVLTWMSFLPKEKHFDKYVKVHATMLYLKAVRQSIKQTPEIFADPPKKLSDGVDIVGFTLGRYIVKEVAELKSKYFDSVVELYRNAFTDFLNEYFIGSNSRDRFITAVLKGMLSGNVGSEARLGVHVLNTCLHDSGDKTYIEIKKLIQQNTDKEVQMFACADIFF